MIGASVQRLVTRRRADAEGAARARPSSASGCWSRLAALAATDELTGLANRRAWEERLGTLADGDTPFALALFDRRRVGGAARAAQPVASRSPGSSSTSHAAAVDFSAWSPTGGRGRRRAA